MFGLFQIFGRVWKSAEANCWKNYPLAGQGVGFLMIINHMVCKILSCIEPKINDLFWRFSKKQLGFQLVGLGAA
jgi:hypothetical protein